MYLEKYNYMKPLGQKRFNAAWYLRQNPDVAASGMDPYEHYKSFGKQEGRKPSPTVSQVVRNTAKTILRPVKQRIINLTKFCYQRFPFSQHVKYRTKNYCYQRLPFLFHDEPSYKFWLRSKTTLPSLSQNGHVIHASEVNDWSILLPATHANTATNVTPPECEVDVIVPVYRGLEQTRSCIDSVLNSTVTTPFRLIIINDASPEVEVTQYLRGLSSLKHVIVVENGENLGFTATVNRGMTMSEKNDVLLLNSDTEVANDWLDKLKAQAYSDSKVGSVTPFSNNATICNYPTLEGMKELPENENVISMDKAFASANKGRNIEIPTAIGFCMYIRRACLSDVGLFDVETFGKGYGEENDFCLRATAKGWKHILAADTFVFHEGEVSFQAGSNPRKERAMQILRQRYPAYESDVAKHVAMNEAYPLRVAATAARYRQSGLPVVLHVVHSYGGGTQKHVDELCKAYLGKAKLLIMSPPFAEAGITALRLRSAEPDDAFDIRLPSPNVDFLVPFIQSLGVSLIHMHHVLGYPFDLQHVVEKLGVPFYFTVHDYMLICPRINLMQVGGGYCGEPEPHECNQCLSENYPQGARDIIWWRESHAWLFKDALAVICPSLDVAQRCKRYYPQASYRVVSHETQVADFSNICLPTLNANEPLRVAILGVLAKHKGLGLVSEALSVAQKINAPLEFRLIGFAEEALPQVAKGLFTQTGAYVDAQLPNLIEDFNPHIILFPARWPETYSYTLTTALNSRRPIMVTNLGAFPERVVSRPWTWIVNWDISAAQLIDQLCEIRVNNFSTSTAPGTIEKKSSGASKSLVGDVFYEKEYLSLGKNIPVKTIRDMRTQGKLTALVMVENVGTQPSPCAYIRLILPLIRERGEKFDFRLVTPAQVTQYAADVLICQRTAVTSIAAISKIAEHCKDNNIRIVYDLDDLLLALPDEHPENAVYAPKSAAVFRWLVESDEVWVSTEELQQQVSNINHRTHILPNYIDDKLWATTNQSEMQRGGTGVLRLLYMGTQTHGADFELVKNVLKKLKKEFADKLEIILIGIAANIDSEKWYQTIIPPHEIGASYPAFVNWISNETPFDIGIAPLVDNEFNRCKSAIKFLDYSALGLATVASDINGYALICNGVNGFRVENTDEDWYGALKKLITDSALRERIQISVQKELFGKHSYGSLEGVRTKHLYDLLSDIGNKKMIDEHICDCTNNENKSRIDINRNLVSAAFLSGEGIEVGALHNPLPVPSGVKVRYVDRFDKPGLYEHYPELRPFNLVNVDFVDNGETLLKFEANTQEFIIANHFLEHCEDPIATLKSFARVMKVGGVVYLALPDMRATFDINRERTALAHLIKDHSEGPISSRFQHYREWAEFVEPHFGRVYATEGEINRRANELMIQSYSIHYHVWLPQDVIEMLKYCREAQGIPFDVSCFISKADEMIILLKKTTQAYKFI